MSAQGPREAVVARLRPHGRRLFWPLLLLVGDAGAATYLVGILPVEWMRWTALGAAALIALVGVVAPVLRWLATRTTITTRRVISRSGLLAQTRRELLHSRGYGVTVRRAGLQHLARTGDVTVSAGQDPPVVIRDVAQPQLVADTLHELVERNAPRISPPDGPWAEP